MRDETLHYVFDVHRILFSAVMDLDAAIVRRAIHRLRHSIPENDGVCDTESLRRGALFASRPQVEQEPLKF